MFNGCHEKYHVCHSSQRDSSDAALSLKGLEAAESLVKDGGKSWYNGPDQFMAQYQNGLKIVRDMCLCLEKLKNCQLSSSLYGM